MMTKSNGKPTLFAIACSYLRPIDEIDDIANPPRTPLQIRARAIAQRFIGQANRIENRKDGGRLRITLAGQNVDDHGGGEYALIERLLAGRFDG